MTNRKLKATIYYDILIDAEAFPYIVTFDQYRFRVLQSTHTLLHNSGLLRLPIHDQILCQSKTCFKESHECLTLQSCHFPTKVHSCCDSLNINTHSVDEEKIHIYLIHYRYC